ncbi:MAG TPA: amidohydrolase, partial [Allosphingosinicella sp.]|nr:amidohydrolase [Allosphingosinicella sp.]
MIRFLAARLCAVLAATVLALIAAPAGAQTLIHNVNGYTIGADGKLIRFSALEIGADGRVRQVLRGRIAPPAGMRMVDGGGRTLIPGLIDAHGHVMGLGVGALQLDLSET